MSKKKKPKKTKKQKPKKSPKKSQEEQSLPKKLQSQLDQLFEAKEWEALIYMLHSLREEYPKAPELYAYECFMGQEIESPELQQHGAYHWARLQPYHPDALANWGIVAMNQMLPGHARRTLRNLLQYYPEHPAAEELAEYLGQLEEVWEEIVDEMGLSSSSDPMQLMCWLEDAQIALQEERFADVISSSRKLLKKHPGYPAAYNSISLAQLALGKIDDALETIELNLDEYDAHNFHALANQIHILMLLGRTEEAEEAGSYLKGVESERDDLWVKQLEGLSFLGDDESVLGCFERAQEACASRSPAIAIKELPHAGLLYHFVGVAHARLGEDEQAKDAFHRALDLEPELSLADRNLDELSHPPHERYEPWAFELNSWLPHRTMMELLPVLQLMDEAEETIDPEQLKPLAESLFQKHPVLLTAMPLLLTRGGPLSAECIAELALAQTQSAPLEALKSFVLGEEGPVELRESLLRSLLERGLFERGSTITFWHKDGPVERVLLLYELSKQADFPLTAPQKERLTAIKEAIEEQRFDQAEGLLTEGLTQEPQHPVYLRTDITLGELRSDPERVKKSTEQLLTHHPDDHWGRCRAALFAIEAGDLDEADRLLAPVLTQPTLAPPTFGLLSEVSIELCLRRGQDAQAKQWLELSEELLGPKKSALLPQLKKKVGFWSKARRWFKKKPSK